MKTNSNRWFISTTLVAICAAFSANAVSVFQDNFESGLGQWEGKPVGGVHSGVIASDPLAGSHGGVLTFGAIKSGGDIFTASVFSAGQYELSFDYLGVTPNAGGYIGTANFEADWVIAGLASPIWGSRWLVGNPYGANAVTEDNQWHHYTIQFDNTAPFKLMLEDFKGNPRDAFFDNIQLSRKNVPDAGHTALLLGMICAMFATVRRFNKPVTQ